MQRQGNRTASRGLRGSALVLALVLAALTPTASAFTLDKSLAGSGVDRIPVGDRDIAGAGGVAVMPDGRTVMSGYAKQGARTLGAIIRLTPAGEADPTFAADTSFPGTVFVDATPGPNDIDKQTLLQDGVVAADGSIYAVGRIRGSDAFDASTQAMIAHVLPDGRMDPAFNRGAPSGPGTIQLTGTTAQQVLLGPDGSVFVLGPADSSGDGTIVTKLLPSGAPAPGFGNDRGEVVLQNLGGADGPTFNGAEMVLDGQGRVVMAGTAFGGSLGPAIFPALARLTAAGGLDPSFGGDVNGDGGTRFQASIPGVEIRGAVAVTKLEMSDKVDGLNAQNQALTGLAIAPDGRIVVAGLGASDAADIGLVGRFTANGKLDLAFGEQGYARLRGQAQPDRRKHNYDTSFDSVVFSGNRIVVVGTQDSVEDSVEIKQAAVPGSLASRTTPDLLVAGITDRGTLDPAAHSGGPRPGVFVLPAGANRFTRVRRVVVAGDKLVIAGRAKAVSSITDIDPDKNPSDFLLVRLGQGTAAPDPVDPGSGDCTTDPVRVGTAVLIGCFKTKGGVSTASSGRVTMNGTRIDLLNGSSLVVDIAERTIRTRGDKGGAGVARLSAAAPGGAVVQISRGPLALKVPKGPGGTRASAAGEPKNPCAPIGSAIGTVSTQGVGNLLGFPLPGSAKLSTAKGVTYLQVNVSLPKPAFVDAGGCATLVTTASGGLQLDSLHVAVGSATLGPLELGSIAIDYTGVSDTWKGTLVLTLPLPKEVKITGDITFVSGDFGAANVAIEFPTAIPIFPAVGLKGINGGIQIKPSTKIVAGVHLVAGPTLFGVAAIDADVQGAVSFPGTPYAIAVDINGRVRVVSIPLGTADVHYDTGGTFTIKGNASFDAFVVGIDVNVDGGVQYPHFFLEGDARVCVIGVCAGASALISEVGAAACGGLTNPIKDLAFGLAVEWRDPIPQFFFHCDLSGYKTFKTSRIAPLPVWRTDAFTAQANAEQTVVVKPGTKAMGLKVSGAQTPLVSIIGPNGERLDGPERSTAGPVRPEEIAHNAVGSIISYRPRNATYIALTAPAPGTWRIVPLLGTTPITGMAQSTVLPQPKVTARVTGKGRRRTLVFKRDAKPGETITFSEQAEKLAHRLGDVRADVRGGTIRFAPGAGRAGRRTIVADVTQDGFPRKRIVVASYVAPGPLLPGKARGVKLRVSGSSAVRATWKPVPGAAKYVVRFRLKDGHRTTVIVRAGRRPAASTPAFLPKKGGQVTVTAIGKTALAGKPSVGVLRPAKR